MGIAVVSGILSSVKALLAEAGDRKTSDDKLPERLPTRVIACVTRPASHDRIKEELSDYDDLVEVALKDNVKSVKQCDVVLLACKPYMVGQILSEQGMKEALKGKLLLSICAGVTVGQLASVLYGEDTYSPNEDSSQCRIVRVMPNTNAVISQSMTVIEASSPELPAATTKLVEWMFEQCGAVITLPPKNMDISTALCGSGPAFCAMFLESMVEGALAMGMPRKEAQIAAAQTMLGTAQRCVDGAHPGLLREAVCTPGGCTIAGLRSLEDKAVRGAIQRALEECANVAGALGSKK